MAWNPDETETPWDEHDDCRARIKMKKYDAERGEFKLIGLHELVAEDDIEMGNYPIIPTQDEETKSIIEFFVKLHDMDRIEVFQVINGNPQRMVKEEAPRHPTNGMVLEIRSYIGDREENVEENTGEAPEQDEYEEESEGEADEEEHVA